MNVENERQALDRISAQSLYVAGASGVSIDFNSSVFERFIRGDSILELGSAEGVMTARLHRLGKRLTVVEGARSFCEDIQRRFPDATVVNQLFEEFEPAETFDNIILGHVLEHVEKPVDLLRRARRWLSPIGQILAAVPNARSLHRQAAVLLGLLQSEDQMNELDIHHGHRRIFNPETFRNVFLQAGLAIEVFGGYWLKPISNKQIEQSWTPQMLHAFMQLGERYPDIAAELYVVASAPRGVA